MQFNQLVKVSDAVANMMCRVAASQPRSNRVYIDMLPFSWLIIKNFIQEKALSMKLPVFHDKDVLIQTIKQGVLVTPDQRIQLATIEREAEPQHKFDRFTGYTSEHITLLQLIFGLFFGIGSRHRHQNSPSHQNM
jgi:hypothetical protein